MVAKAVELGVKMLWAAAPAIGAWWYGNKALKELQKGQSSSVEAPPPAMQMQNAEDEAKKKLKDAPIADTCVGDCKPPPGCQDRNKKINQRRDELKQRYDEMREDGNDLFNKHFSELNAHPIYGIP